MPFFTKLQHLIESNCANRENIKTILSLSTYEAVYSEIIDSSNSLLWSGKLGFFRGD